MSSTKRRGYSYVYLTSIEIFKMFVEFSKIQVYFVEKVFSGLSKALGTFKLLSDENCIAKKQVATNLRNE